MCGDEKWPFPRFSSILSHSWCDLISFEMYLQDDESTHLKQETQQKLLSVNEYVAQRCYSYGYSLPKKFRFSAILSLKHSLSFVYIVVYLYCVFKMMKFFRRIWTLWNGISILFVSLKCVSKVQLKLFEKHEKHSVLMIKYGLSEEKNESESKECSAWHFSTLWS